MSVGIFPYKCLSVDGSEILNYYRTFIWKSPYT